VDAILDAERPPGAVQVPDVPVACVAIYVCAPLLFAGCSLGEISLWQPIKTVVIANANTDPNCFTIF